jgi:hypothetical protein
MDKSYFMLLIITLLIECTCILPSLIGHPNKARLRAVSDSTLALRGGKYLVDIPKIVSKGIAPVLVWLK